MAIPQDEPKSPEQGQQWVGKHAREHDRFAHVAAKYDGHRATHGCYDVYPYPNGSLLGTMAATHRGGRILEVGAVSVTAPSGLPMAPDPERCRIRRARPWLTSYLPDGTALSIKR